jgi:integrase
MVGRLRCHVLPVFGERDVKTLARGELWAHLRTLAKKHPVTANRTFAAMRCLFGWLSEIDQEHLGVVTNPTAGLGRPGGAEQPRPRTYTDDEVKRVLEAVSGREEGDLVEWIFATACRDAEARGMTWDEVDESRKLWTIAARRSKNHRPRQVPLSSLALAVLERRRAKGYASDRVFPRARQSKTLRAAAVKAGMLRRVEEVWEGEALRLHDIRRTVGDRIRAEHGEASMHAALGHTDAKLTLTYGPSPRLRALAAVFEWWAGELRRVAWG